MFRGGISLLDYLKRLAPRGSQAPDRELLERFAVRGDEMAFAAVVRRHGPMVWGVCLRQLADLSDAEDAFQATFLVLARKAHALGRRELLGNWLYGVALRTARKAKCLRARRRAHERQVEAMPQMHTPGPKTWSDLSLLLDAELARLADKYRKPILLCYFEGMSRTEAAAALGWPAGTVAGRLARALDLLRDRLARRGLAVTASVLAAALAEQATASVPPELVSAIVKAAPGVATHGLNAGIVSAPIASLMKGVIQAMHTASVARIGAAMLVLGLVAISGVAIVSRVIAGDQAANQSGKLSGAGSLADPEPGQQAARAGEKQTGKESKRLGSEQALTLLREYLQDDPRARNFFDNLKVKEITPEPLWDKLQTQLFVLQHEKGVPFMDHYLIRGKTVVPLQRSLPAFRFSSACVADLRHDGKPLLAFSYTFGSGVLRSQVAVLDVRAKEPQPVAAPQTLVLDPRHEWQVKAVDEETVRVEGGSVVFGDLVLEEKDGKPALRIKLRDDLPEKLKQKIQETPQPQQPDAKKSSLKISVDLPAEEPTLADVNSGRYKVIVKFENVGKEEQVLWPYLSLKILDDKGREVDISKGIGRYGAPPTEEGGSILEVTKFITLKPGATHELRVSVPNYDLHPDTMLGWKLPAAGSYKLVFSYQYDRAAARKDYGRPLWGRPMVKDLDNARHPWNRAHETDQIIEATIKVK
jgi:RNA polymerase sigma factor (sigma-70 family)